MVLIFRGNNIQSIIEKFPPSNFQNLQKERKSVFVW